MSRYWLVGMSRYWLVFVSRYWFAGMSHYWLVSVSRYWLARVGRYWLKIRIGRDKQTKESFSFNICFGCFKNHLNETVLLVPTICVLVEK